MLSELYIKNFALIDELKISFEKGFNVITGETGSGKSIVIDAISLILGKKASKSIIKKGRDKAVVEVLFISDSADISNYINSLGIDNQDGQIVLTREVSLDGRSVCRLNNRIVSLNDMKNISSKILSIHGQNEYEIFSTTEKQIHLIDSFGESAISDKMDEYKSLYHEMQNMTKELNYINENMNEAQILRELDFLNFEINEIETANIKENEREDIKEKLKILENAELINSAKSQIYDLLYGNNSSILSNLFKVINKLENIEEYYPNANELLVNVREAYYNLEDISNQISYSEDIEESNYSDIDNFNIRLNKINDIYRKYGNSYDKILEYKEKSILKRNNILDRENKTKYLKEEIAKIETKLFGLGKDISKERKKIADDLSIKIKEELCSLNMKEVNLTFDFSETNLSKNGIDFVDLKISFNKGEDLKTLNKVASGGEMSRFMLALKNIIAKYDDINTIIFDEIDTGVSGVAANVIGQKLKSISEYRQVICVSHLPQVASFANTHFFVSKESDDISTKTFIRRLNREDRILELAKMMTGENVTKESIDVVNLMLMKNMSK